MEGLSNDELMKKGYEQALRAQELTLESQCYFREVNRRALDEAKSDIVSFRKDADKFIKTVVSLGVDMEDLDKQIAYLENKYGADAFHDEERQIFYTLKMAGALLKAFQLATKK